MKGAINYLRAVRDICEKNKGNCKRCPIGNKRKLEDNICPRLTNPASWSDERIAEMVRVENVKQDETLIDLVAKWDAAVEKYGFIN